MSAADGALPDREALIALLMRWISARPHAGFELEPVAIPDDLAATLVDREPERSAALEIAGEWLSIPRMTGIGFRFDQLEVGESVELPDGGSSARDITVHCLWDERMDNLGGPSTPWSESFERVDHVDGRWRISSLVSPEKHAADMEQLRAFLEWRQKEPR